MEPFGAGVQFMGGSGWTDRWMWNGHFCLFMDRCLKFDVADGRHATGGQRGGRRGGDGGAVAVLRVRAGAPPTLLRLRLLNKEMMALWSSTSASIDRGGEEGADRQAAAIAAR